MEFLKALVIVMLLSVTGCSSIDKYLGNTEASYTLPSGENLSYKSNKNQENFKAHLALTPEGKLSALDVETTAVTPELAIAKFAEAQAKMMDTLSQFMMNLSNQLSVLIPAAAKAGAVAGS